MNNEVQDDAAASTETTQADATESAAKTRRMNRLQFWLFTAMGSVTYSLIYFVLEPALGMQGAWNTTYEMYDDGPIATAFLLLFGVLSIIMGVNRLHDRDKSGWWFLIYIIPVLGWAWYYIEQGFLKGTDGPNRFGGPNSNSVPFKF